MGDASRGAAYCQRCRGEYRPTRLQQWRSAIGWSVEDIATATGLTQMTVQRALRGERLGTRAAAELARVTEIPAPHFRAGEQ